MAGGTGADFKVYDNYFQMGLFERLSQNINAFGGPSANTLRLTIKKLVGNFSYEGLFKEIANLDSYRDITSIASQSDLKMTQGEFIGVKLNRKIGPVLQTLDAWKKIGKTQEEMSFILGQQAGDAITQSYLHRSIISIDTCLDKLDAGTDTVVKTDLANNLSYSLLNNGNRLMGDASNQILCYVMHSKQWHDLVGDSITQKITDVASVAIQKGQPFSLDRTVLVTDDAALINEDGVSSGVDSYNCLGLVAGAAEVEQTEDTTQIMTLVDDLANIAYRFRVEYAFNMNVKGMQYVAATGINPNDATLGTESSWAKVVTSLKNGPGIKIVTK